MTAHPLATARAAEAFLACPEDGARLKTGPGEVTCPSCGTRWPRIGKVPVFSDPDGYWGEIPQREMEPLLEEAELEGWDRALRRRLLGETGELRDRPDAGADEEGAAPRGRFLYDYATDASRADWRFLLPLNEDSRVLDIGAGWGALSMAIAPEVGLVVAADDMVERARFLEIRARQSGFDHVQPIATPAQDIPFPDGTFDLVILNGVLEWVGLSRVRRNPRDVQRLVLENIHRKIAPGGSLYIGIENRYGYHYFTGTPDDHTKLRGTNLMPRFMAQAWTRMRTGRDYRAYTHSLDGYRRLLKSAGFGGISFHATLPTYRNPREIIPLDDPTVFDHYATRTPARTVGRRVKVALARAGFRAGVIPRLIPHYAILATRERSR